MSLLKTALSQHGAKEFPGSTLNNPEIMKFSKETGLDWVKSDETSWCAIFMYWCVMNASTPFCNLESPPKSKAASARAWLQCGVEVDIGRRRQGDIAIFWRNNPTSWQGHVGIYINDTPGKADSIQVLGGNQGDQVCIQEFSLEKILGFRRL